MTTTATTPTTPRAPASGPHLTFAGILNSEWIKLRTLRSTFWCYVIVVALTVLLGLLFAGTVSASTVTLDHDSQQSVWMSAATLGVNFGQLVIGVLGALVITGEYGTGMIRSTFAAVPKRTPALVAKAIVFGVVTFIVSFIGLVASALVTAPLLAGKGVTADFGDLDVWLTLLGGAGYLALIGLISLAIGLLIRNSAGGIAAALGLVLVVPVIFSLLYRLAKADWAANLGAFLPSNAGAKIWAYPVSAAASGTTSGTTGGGGTAGGGTAATTASGIVDLTSWEGLLVVIGWFAVLFVFGLIALKRRDA